VNKIIRREYNYSDVYLIPKKTIVDSRSEVDTSVQLGKRRFSLPIVAANMKSVVDDETCEYFAKKNMFYINHRFGNDPIKFIDMMKSKGYYSSISIGVNEDSYKQLKDIKEANLEIDYVCLDIANSWSPKAERMIKHFKDAFPDTFLIVGNMATGEAVEEIEYWGADCCKIQIGPGRVCQTKNNTGFSRPTLSCLLDCVAAAKNPIISDGGVVDLGDIAKIICAGGTMAMAGSLFSGYSQSAGETIIVNDKVYKEYYGSASEHSKNSKNHIEGKRILVDYKGDMDDFIKTLSDSIKSSVSYAGGRDLSALLSCEMVAIN
jgi:GMP reductase